MTIESADVKYPYFLVQVITAPFELTKSKKVGGILTAAGSKVFEGKYLNSDGKNNPDIYRVMEGLESFSTTSVKMIVTNLDSVKKTRTRQSQFKMTSDLHNDILAHML